MLHNAYFATYTTDLSDLHLLAKGVLYHLTWEQLQEPRQKQLLPTSAVAEKCA